MFILVSIQFKIVVWVIRESYNVAMSSAFVEYTSIYALSIVLKHYIRTHLGCPKGKQKTYYTTNTIIIIQTNT